MQKFFNHLAFLTILVLFVGCMEPITSGVIIKKEFVPEHEVDDPDIVIDDITIPGGTSIVPDAWYITFQKEFEDGTKRSRSLEVSESYFNEVKVGDLFNIEWKKHKGAR